MPLQARTIRYHNSPNVSGIAVFAVLLAHAGRRFAVSMEAFPRSAVSAETVWGGGRPGGNRGVILTGIASPHSGEILFAMNEPRDGQSWPEISPPCGLVSFDAAPFGCLRFSSIFARFPLSIAFPGWSQPMLDLDGDGYGTADFPGAFRIRRVPIPAGLNNRSDIETFALEQFAARQETLRL